MLALQDFTRQIILVDINENAIDFCIVCPASFLGRRVDGGNGSQIVP